MNSRGVVSAALVLVLLAFAGTALADATWTGASSANWSDPDNWSPAGVPPAGVVVTFPSDATRFDVTVDTNVTDSVLIQADYQLSLGANTLKTERFFLEAHTVHVTASAGGLLDVDNLFYPGTLVMRGGVARLGGSIGSPTLDVDTLELVNAGLYTASVTANRVTGNGRGGNMLTVTGDITPSNGGIGSSTLNLTGAVHHVTVDTTTPVLGTNDAILTNATLSLTRGPNGPPPGKIVLLTYTHSLTGTYNGLPEGALVTVGSDSYRITYSDSGQNVALRPLSGPALITWTGAADASWSDPANWSPAGVPSNGDDLIFPQGARLTTNNDALTSVGKLTIGDAYTIGGNPLQIGGGIERNGPSTTAQINLNLTLTASQTFGARLGSPLTFNGSVDVNGKTLQCGYCTLNGPLNGTGTINGTGASGGYIGPLTLNAANNSFTGQLNDLGLTLAGSAPGATLVAKPVSPSSLTANDGATIGDVALVQGVRIQDASGHAGIGLLHTGVLKLIGQGLLGDGAPEYAHDFVDIDGSSSDSIDVHGIVILNYAALDVNVLSPAPLGTVYTIISNDGTDPVNGTFEGFDAHGYFRLEEGTVVYPYSGGAFRISYKGGDGNDVTLTAVGDKFATTTHVTASPDVTTVPGTVHVTVTVTPAATGVPDGTVSISERGVPVASATLQNGAATIDLNITNPGQHAFAVAYSGSAAFESSSANFTVVGAGLKIDAADASTAEGDFGTHTLAVPVTLSTTRTTDVTITYHTEDRTATAGEDYLGTSGTLTIPAGARSASIAVTIIGDVKPELDEQFWIVLDHASDGTFGKPRVAVSIVNDDAAYTRASAIVYASPDATPLTLDVLTPIGATRPLPVVVAFVDGPDESTVARETLRGYVVVVPKIRTTFPAGILDAKAAVRWVRANGGQQYEIDPTRVAAWGIGSGGHVAALLGTSAGVEALDGDGSMSARLSASSISSAKRTSWRWRRRPAPARSITRRSSAAVR